MRRVLQQLHLWELSFLEVRTELGCSRKGGQIGEGTCLRPILSNEEDGMTGIILGQTIVVGDPSRLQPRAPQPRQRQSSQTPLVTQVVSLEEAQHLADFQIYRPNYLPPSGLTPTGFSVVSTTALGNKQTFAVVTKYRGEISTWMVVYQTKIPGPNQLIVASDTRGGNIGRYPAAFSTQSISGPNSEISILHCYWEQDEFLMHLSSYRLPLAETIRVGEALH